ncbi:MAG: hypothetical protein K9J13_14370 [Saprospiraceae bacterium]|nr:hypothetical protein [Saprospiraceae bacterium]
MKDLKYCSFIIVLIIISIACNKPNVTVDEFPVSTKRQIPIAHVDSFGILHNMGLDLLSEDEDFPMAGDMDFSIIFSELLDNHFGVSVSAVWNHVEELMENRPFFDDFPELSDHLTNEFSISSYVAVYLDDYEDIMEEVEDENTFKTMISDFVCEISVDENLNESEKLSLKAGLSIMKYSFDYWSVAFTNSSEWDVHSDECKAYTDEELEEAIRCDVQTFIYVYYECQDAGWSNGLCEKMALSMAIRDSFGVWIPPENW